MTKPKYYLTIGIIVSLVLICYYQSNVKASEFLLEEDIVEKTFTKMDSLIFQYDSLLSHSIDSLGSVEADKTNMYSIVFVF